MLKVKKFESYSGGMLEWGYGGIYHVRKGIT